MNQVYGLHNLKDFLNLIILMTELFGLMYFENNN